MKNYLLFLTAFFMLSITAYSQTPRNGRAAPELAVMTPHFDKDIFIFLGKKDNMMHLVWDEITKEKIVYYVVQQSTDGRNFNSIDSLQPLNLFDIHANNYPQNISYENTFLYSTETGNGRFIYNDVLTASEMTEVMLWYRIKMVTTKGYDIYTKKMQKEVNTRANPLTGSLSPGLNLNSNLPAQFSNNLLPGGSGNNNDPMVAMRMVGCPAAQAPPVGYVYTGNFKIFYGQCCYWEEREYRQSLITAPCGNAQAWCCPFDCQPLAYDPCCVHTCGEYGSCSCHPWTCCDVSNANVWIVYSSTDYSFDATVANITNPSCNDFFDGSVEITINPGLPQAVLFNWDNGIRTGVNVGNIIPGLEAGIYSLTIEDATGCSETLNFTLTEPPALNSSLSIQNVTCFGLNDGYIDVSVSGGVPPYSYTWLEGNNPLPDVTQDLTGIGAGNYAVTITDANGCVSNEFNPVLEPGEFLGVVTLRDLSCPIAGTAVLDLCCFGVNTGSAILELSGGTAPVNIVWSDGSTESEFTGLTAGTYSVTAYDANGCSFSTDFTLGQRDEIVLTASSTSASCGQCNGSATVNVSGGSGGFSWQWPPSAGNQTTTEATNLCAGSYTVIVSDLFAINCFKVITVSVSNTGGETITTSKTDASCPGVCDGSATVSFNCADGPCSVEWFDPQGASFSQANSVSNLCAGSYSVVVTNASGCVTSETVEILQQNSFISNLSIVNETCDGACDGLASTAPTGGQSPYSFQWLDSTATPIPNANNSLITDLCSGNYTLVITDAIGCTSSFPFSIMSLNNLFATTVVTQYACFSDCEGSISVAPLGGQPPYLFEWFDNGSPNPSVAGFNRSGLCAGTYSVKVTGQNGCTYTTPDIFINEPAELSASISSTTDLTCTSVCSGSASVIASGGTGILTYTWFNKFAVEITGETDTSIANLCAQNYFVEVTDNAGCSTGLLPFTINDINPLTVTLTATDVSCNGAADGAIDLEASGGFPPYSFSWNGGAFDTEDLTGLSAGTYTVVITDSSGCSISDSITVNEPDVLISPINIKTFGAGGFHVSCLGFTNGQLNVDASGGTQPYSYSWDNGQVGSSAIGLGLGTYAVTVTDNNGCTAENSETLFLEPGPFTSEVTAFVYPTGFNVSCFGASDGSIDLTVTGGEAPFIFNWTLNSTLDAYLVEDPTNVPAGLYAVNVVDTSLGCIVRDTITLTEPTEIVPILTPSVYMGGVNVSTNGGSDGSIDLEVSGGAAPYTYEWSNGETTQDIDSLMAGLYECTITDTTGCQVIASLILRQPEPSLEVIDTTICEGACVFAAGECQTTSGSYTDSLQNIFGLDSIIVTNLTVLPASRTTVQVSICHGQSVLAGGADQTESGTYYDTLVAANGCDSIISTELDVIAVVSLTFDIVDAGCDALCDGSVTATATGGNLPYTIEWSTGDSVTSLTDLCGGDYTLTVTDADGCNAVEVATIAGGQPIDATVTAKNNTCNCINQNSSHELCVINFSGLPHGTLLNEQYAGQGIHISAEGFNGGLNQLIAFNSGSTGTPDPDLEVSEGNLAIIPDNLTDSDGDGLVDTPNDYNDGGKQIYTFDTPRDVVSFKFVDMDGPAGTATAYDAQNNVIASATIPVAGNGSVQTVMLNAQGVSRLEIDYSHESGGVTEINLGCTFECCDGQLTVAPSSGAAPFSYEWSNGETTETITDLCPGTYDVTITDANGCQFATSGTVNEFVELEISVAKQDLSPECSASGSITDLNFNDLAAGTILNEQYAQHGIHISGDAYSVFPDDIILYNADQTPGGPDPDLETGSGNLAIFPERITDSNGDGLVDVPNDQGRGGVMTFTFDQDMIVLSFVFVDKELNDPGIVSAYDANNDLLKTVSLPNKGNGSVQTVIVNASGVRKLVLDYKDSGGLQSIRFGHQISCCDGTADATVSGGNPPYSYAWSNGASTASVDSLCPGNYTVTATDQDGCDISQTIRINDCSLSISGLTLVDGSNDLLSLGNGESITISLDSLCLFSFRADICDLPVGSIRFKVNGVTFRTENIAPYSLNGDNPNGYYPWNPQPGDYTIEATPHSGANASGNTGTLFTIHVTVTGTPCAARLSSVQNVNSPEFEMDVYPIPFNDQLIIAVNAVNSSYGNLKLVDMLGREVVKRDIEVISGNNTFSLDLSKSIPEAVYFLEVQIDNQVKTVKVIKAH